MTISIVGAKGGTAKSSTAHALAHVFAAAGLDVVLVDADPQGSLTRRLGLERATNPLATDPLAILPVDGGAGIASQITLFPGGRALEAADEDRFAAHLRRATGLGSDLVLVDTPPALGPIVRAAMSGSDLILVPCCPGAESLDGLADMRAAAHDVRPGVQVRAVMVLAHRRSNILRWTQTTAESLFPDTMYADVTIPFEVAAAEAGTLGMPVTASAPRSRAATAYRELTRRLSADLGLRVHIPEPGEV